MFRRWDGPYEAVERFNPAAQRAWDTRDPFQTRCVTIRDPYAIQTPISALDEYDMESTPVVYQPVHFQRGKFVIFRLARHGRKWKRQVYAAEIYYDFDRCDGVLTLHFYSEL